MNLGLQKKILLQMFSICFILVGVYFFSSYKQREVAGAYRNISFNQFPKVESASKMIAKFRQIRIKVRTLGLSGNTHEVQQKYIKETKGAISQFLEEKKRFESMSFSSEEQEYVNKLNLGWKEFLAFGADLLSKYERPTPESLSEGVRMIRDVCPIKANKWMSVAEEFLDFQSRKTKSVVKETADQEHMTSQLSLFAIGACSILSLLIGVIFSRKTVVDILNIVKSLQLNVGKLESTSHNISKSSAQLSETATTTLFFSSRDGLFYR